MLTLKLQQASENLEHFCEKLIETNEPLYIELPNDKNVVIITQEAYDKMKRPL